ncbi:DUF2066 domain-containing protein [Aminobacter sp. MDW-2]|jgi:hypothetical protein|uniref:DUF2066 domain-containing protein n=1 Tax=Aminobacter sp. MDW-2 TaxID=2666139 RepID=UPI0012B09ADB|nr:DUF2066 domain-containing protein [Aminobacter sp. MDW-2]MRX32892.1 DUF2066 domain-containing protein [Aminobacter sp. MDW-2]QNH34453.1 DUF2066 domain-containing protein [Aminobacter sp. MDW-2]WMC97683.1 DUF2066 domain-containing protein [Aminobacter aminovorans]
MLRGGLRNALTALLLLFAGVGQARADDLYSVGTITSGTAPERRDIGFANCLRNVVVRVTGDSRLLNEPRLAKQAAHAGELIASHSFRDRMSGTPIHDEQGSYDRPHDLTCVFDRTKLDAFLKSFDHKPWLKRPRLVAVIGALDMKGRASMLASDSIAPRDEDMRAALVSAADKAALPLLLPSQQQLMHAGLSASTLAKADPARLGTLARMAGGERALVGTIVWNSKPAGWVAEWRIADASPATRWGISGVGFDDAFRNAVSGAAQVLSGHEAP